MSRRSQFEQRRLPLLASLHQAEAAHGRPATVRSLATSIDAGLGTTHEYLKRLREEGLVEWEEDRVRTLRLTEAGRRAATTEGESNPPTITAGQGLREVPVAEQVNAIVPAVALGHLRVLDPMDVGF